jgi:undecaprenyl-diphosphatase
VNDDGWYRAVTQWAQQTRWLQEPALLFTEYGIVLLALASLWILWRVRYRDSVMIATALWIPLAMVLAPAAGLVIKSIVAEPRPCRSLVNVTTVLACDGPTDYSFPSNHSAICAAFAVALFVLHRRWGLVAGIFAVLMAASRVYVGAHYPHDVIVGLVVGGLVGALGYLVRGWLAPLVDRLRARVPRLGAAR